jgi:hypothetical protein
MLVLGDRNVGKRAALLAPVRDQLIEALGVDHRAGQDVGADLRALFQDADAELAPAFIGELLQADGGGQAGGTRPDDDHIVRHGLAFAQLFSPSIDWPQLRPRVTANSQHAADKAVS